MVHFTQPLNGLVYKKSSFWCIFFPKNLVEREQHVQLVLDKLKEVELYAKLDKCEFHQTKVEIFSYIIFGNDIYMDSCMV